MLLETFDIECRGRADAEVSHFAGFAIFARDMDMAISNPCWSKQTPPWLKQPEVEAPAELPKAA